MLCSCGGEKGPQLEFANISACEGHKVTEDENPVQDYSKCD